MEDLFNVIKEELGGVTDQEFIPTLKTHKNVNLLESYDIPEIMCEVKLFQFKETYIVYSCFPGLIERISLASTRISGIITFAHEAYKIRDLINN